MGLFSGVLAKDKRISIVTFLAPWWQAFGSHYPDWGAYIDYGRVSTQSAYEIAKIRISRARLPNRIVEIGYSYDLAGRTAGPKLGLGVSRFYS
jgi:hypothetical protein